MTFYREANRYLQDWKSNNYRKPLIIRGARQVGKTTLVKEFAQEYGQSILLNLEKQEHRDYFERMEDARRIVDSLYLSFNLKRKKEEPNLLFIDAIQESPKAIQMLRYFYEEIPELHVIAAGSLLEFALRDVQSFPIGGKIKRIFPYAPATSRPPPRDKTSAT